MKTPLLAGETFHKVEPANLQRGWETVGGQLALTNQRLIFESHFFNINRGRTEIDLSNVISVQECWTKFLNLFPIYPNSIAVATKQGEEFHLVVYGRATWIDAIKKRMPFSDSLANA